MTVVPALGRQKPKECFRDQSEQRDSLFERKWAGGEEEKENGGRGRIRIKKKGDERGRREKGEREKDA